MKPVVVDASIAVLWFAKEAGSERAATLLEADTVLLAPDLMPIEAANALWKKSARNEIEASLVEQSLVNLLALDLTLVSSRDLLIESYRLAAASRHPVYDCLYLALARERDALLATVDRGLQEVARSLPGKPVGLWSAPTRRG